MVKRRRGLPLKRVQHRITSDEGMEPAWSWLQSLPEGARARELAVAARIGATFLTGQAVHAGVPSNVAPAVPRAEVVPERVVESTAWQAGDFAVPEGLGSGLH